MKDVNIHLMVHILAKRFSGALTTTCAFQFFWFYVLNNLLHSMPFNTLIATPKLIVSNYYLACFPLLGGPHFVNMSLWIVSFSTWVSGFTISRHHENDDICIVILLFFVI